MKKTQLYTFARKYCVKNRGGTQKKLYGIVEYAKNVCGIVVNVVNIGENCTYVRTFCRQF